MSTAHETRSNLCSPFLAIAPVTGASVSVLAGSSGQSTMCSSDATSALLDEMQFDLGEGPCWEALSTRLPVLAPRVRVEENRVWPIFAQTLRSDPRNSSVRAIYAFPLVVGSLDIGAVDLYSTKEGDLTGSQVTNVLELAGLTAWQVLRRILTDGTNGIEEEDTTGAGSRREVHQATGMVLAQMNISAADAGLLLRAHAFSTGRSVREVASDIVSRQIDFSGNRNG
ncbi:hypothetical protein BHD05_11305 [Marisediminicola antarctica]|uniref:ANTAR domain-containing protein n=1 Tax=Marisediminicola antarctica TaxID=674079 RepID=A0A7L5AKN2_9MICO|nr:hypothetical protein BHD05_11305 [Marisediminicola antarctica]